MRHPYGFYKSTLIWQKGKAREKCKNKLWSWKYPAGEMSLRGNILVGKYPVSPSGKFSSGKCQSGICPRALGEMSIGELSFGELSGRETVLFERDVSLI